MKDKDINIVVINDKGGSAKSTVSFQSVCAYFLNKKIQITLSEFDDQNQDSLIFEKSIIKTEQIPVGNGDGLNDSLRDLFLNGENNVFDVGGNKTTTLFLESLKSTRMYKKVDLYVIPASGGSQDIKNAIKTYDMITSIDKQANIIFGLSRVRNPRRINFQYKDFFNNPVSKKVQYFLLLDSDVIDLSRTEQKSVYEIANDNDYKNKLEKNFDIALDKNDSKMIQLLSTMLEIYDEAEVYNSTTLKNAFDIIDDALKTAVKAK